jgi:hypothetical protein
MNGRTQTKRRLRIAAVCWVVLGIMGQGIAVSGSTDYYLPYPLVVQGNDSSPASAITASGEGAQESVLDLHSNGTDQIRFFSPTPEGDFLRSYFNNQGALYTNAWMVISGELGGKDSLVPGDLPPTEDSFMLGVWSDVPGPAVVVRPTGNVPSDAPFTTMDLFGDYRFVIQEDGSLQFAGSGPSTNGNGFGAPYSATVFDTTLHRVGPGQLRTEGDFGAENYAVALWNASGNSVVAGTVLGISSNVDDAFTISDIDSDSTVAGIALSAINSNVKGPVVTHGVVGVQVIAPVSRGSVLVSFGRGAARALQPGEVPPAGAIIGKALMQSNVPAGSSQVIDVLVNVM